MQTLRIVSNDVGGRLPKSYLFVILDSTIDNSDLAVGIICHFPSTRGKDLRFEVARALTLRTFTTTI